MSSIDEILNPSKTASRSYMMGINNPYMMSMGNPYMMGMQPQTIEQYKNSIGLSTDLQQKQLSFMGKFNPFFSTDRKTRLDMTKSIFDMQIDFATNYSPYSKQNFGKTKEFMTQMNDYQMNMMMNPFAMGYGNPVLV